MISYVATYPALPPQQLYHLPLPGFSVNKLSTPYRAYSVTFWASASEGVSLLPSHSGMQ